MTANRRVSCVAGLWLASSCAAQVVLPDADGDGHPIFGTLSVRPDFEFDGDHEPRGGKATCIAFGDLDGDGDPDAVCTLNDTRDVSYITVMFNAGDGVMGPPTAYLAGSGSCAVDLADVDRDGDVDAAIANFRDDTIGVLRNDGAGVLGGLVKFRVGSDPRSLKFADVNRDGAPDLVALNVGSRDVSVLLNDGAGGYLWPGARIAVSGVTGHNGHSGPHLDVADLDGDGAIDVAVPAGSSIKMLMNQGDGSFELAATHPRLVAPSAYHVLARDLDGDGDDDLACAVSEGSGGDSALQVFKNDGNAGFGPPDAYSIDPWDCDGCWFDTTTAAAGDFDGDGDADIIVGQNSFEFTTIFHNAGDGTFTRESIDSGYGTWFMQAVDLNGSGVDEAVSVHGGYSRSLVRAMLDTEEAFRPMPLAEDSSNQTSVAASDLDLDGDPDLVVGMHGGMERRHIRVYKNMGSRRLVPMEAITLGPLGASTVESLAIGDLDGDSIPDVVAADATDIGGFDRPGKVWVLLGLGDGTFGDPTQIPFEDSTPHWITLGDLDADGDLDAVVWTTQVFLGYDAEMQRRVAVFRNQSGTLVADQSIFIGQAPYYPLGTVELSDLDSDGDLDVLATYNARDGDGAVVILANDGQGSLSAHQALPSHPLQAMSMDIDLDGWKDIVVRLAGDVQQQPFAEWYRNTGPGAYARSGELVDHTGVKSSAMVIHRLLPNSTDAILFTLLGDLSCISWNAGSTSTRAGYATIEGPFAIGGPKIASSDYDSDGRIDIVVTQDTYKTPVILWNAGAFPCPPDLNHDRRLNVFDFLAFQRAFGDEDPAADLADPRGVLDLADYAAFREFFAAGCR